MRHISITAALLFILVADAMAQDAELRMDNANATFEIGDVFVSAGETYLGELKVPSGDDGIDSFIPITVHHGANPGPVLSLIAGIHGSEYSPILAMQELAGLIDPSQMSGTL
ncbi:MAG: hypothetical protein P8N11_01960, partial [Gammaproteobacteria bacterium]|nr:hypothetical protein [Gammaproteobacteria bacterium]